jgi:hypothetical protein
MYAWACLLLRVFMCDERACGRVNVIVMGMGLAGRVQSIPLEEVLLNKSQENFPLRLVSFFLLSPKSRMETVRCVTRVYGVWCSKLKQR